MFSGTVLPDRPHVFSHLVCIVDVLTNGSVIMSLNFLYAFIASVLSVIPFPLL